MLINLFSKIWDFGNWGTADIPNKSTEWNIGFGSLSELYPALSEAFDGVAEPKWEINLKCAT